ncbi:MAG: NAD(P)H-dependent glycerol-3-phosphate dehydrogenase [Eubacteriales bacterium]|nr:NAD(P)-dependent glycerol-3-phosphate dehydrogenase [Lachnospiraceae bacterium]MDO5127050.1 NAD(P)H-dependent glycerol-3-phosphate dehydrogenase [Eubacteriales bacterium]
MKIGILGAGSWGIALTVLLSDNGHDVTVWSIDPDEIEMLNTYREHKTKLSGVKISDNVCFTTDLGLACKDAALIVMVVPSPYIRSTAKMVAPYITKDQIVVNVSKGIEESTLMTLTEVIEEEIPGVCVGVLSGPSHAEEVGKRMPTTVVCSAHNQKTALMIQDVFISEYFRVYTSPDMLGIELGGALKNVIALAAGIADGLGCGDNTKAALITRGISEITRLGLAMGGKQETFAGLSGIGDLIVTCASTHSRNRRAGVLMGQGKTYKEAMDEVQMVVEGVYSAKAALMLSQKYQIEMPIVEMVNKVLFENLPAKDALYLLLTRMRTVESKSLSWDES